MGRPRKRKNEPALLQVKTYLNPQSVTEAEISEFIGTAMRMRGSTALRAMLSIAWKQMQQFDREEFEQHFKGSHNFTAFERLRAKHTASIEADSLLIHPPTPKLK
jgi:hypothetical protein